MKRITTHHDGHGRMEQIIVVATDEPAAAPNSSHHRYEFFFRPAPYQHFPNGPDGDPETMQEPDIPLGVIQFQRGPFGAEGSTPGTLSNAVLAVMIDHMKGFLAGPLADRYTAIAVTKLEEASWALRARADERAARGVLGSMSK